jgi:hypothetical protein
MKYTLAMRIRFSPFEIKYYRSNSVQTVTLFKILNDVTVCKQLNL